MALKQAILFASLALPAAAQAPPNTPVTTADQVNARLSGQPLILRGFWMADDMSFDAAGKPADVYPTGSFTLAGFHETSATVANNILTLKGERIGLTFDKNGASERVTLHGSRHGGKPEKVSLQIAANTTGDFAPALDAIFATTLREVSPEMPDLWDAFARKLENGDDPNDTLKAEVLEIHPHTSGSPVKPPVVTKMVDPQYSEAARRLRFSGKTEVYLWVGKDGHPDHIRIVRPIGLGLDEAAADAVSNYLFVPATRDGQPVLVDVYVEVNFQIF